jgi:hypothetical protein
MPGGPTVAVLGLRPHTYWTAAVVLAGSPDAPRVLERARILFAAGKGRSVYHHTAEVNPGEAENLIEHVRAATTENAARQIAILVADLQRSGVEVRTAVSAAAITKLPDNLADILRVHARMHAAEGNFYRDVVASGCQAAGLEVRRVVERELPALMCDLLGVTAHSLKARLKAMGAALGPPWSEDYRLAAQAAWLRLGDGGTANRSNG